MTKRAWILLLIALFFLQVADGILTWYALDTGLATEGNAIANKLISSLGLVSGLLILKLSAVILIFTTFLIFKFTYKKSANSGMSILLKISIVICVVINGYDVANWVIFILK